MVKVWRMQNKRGKGPYWKIPKALEDDLVRNCPRYWNGTIRRPSSTHEFGREQGIREFCGFLTQEKAMRWFPKKVREILAKHGFHLVHIPVTKVTAGSVKSQQVLFVK